MASKKKPVQTKQKRERAKADSRSREASSTVYKDFSRWSSKKSPPWHPIKKMRYVFFRMIGGETITDAIREIHWSAAEFWHLVDLKRHGPFREEYKRAKILQGRSFSDSVVTIAEGRDRTTRRHQKRIDRLVEKAMRKIAKNKSKVAQKILFGQLMADLREHDKIIITRNKLQVDGAKWMAKTSNPAEFSEQSKVSLGTPTGDGGDNTMQPLIIQFVGPDGKVVPV